MPPSPPRTRPFRIARAAVVLAACSFWLAGCRCNRSSSNEPSETRASGDDEPKAQPPPYFVRASASDARTTLVAWRGQGKVDGVRAVRVDASGKVLDTKPIVLSAHPHDADLAVAARSGEFWVVWEHFPKGPGVHVQGVRVSTAGKVLDEAPKLLTGSEGTQRSPAISCSESGCLLLFHDFREGSYGSLHGLHLDAAGKPSKPFAFVGKSHRSSALATTRAGYLVAFSGGLKPNRNDVSTLMVPSDPNARAPLPEPSPVAESDSANGVRLACNDQQCFAAWLHSVKVEGGPRHQEVGGMRVYVTPSRSEIWGCRLQPDGRVVDGAKPTKLRELATGPSRIEVLTLGAGATGFLLAWQATAFGEGGRSSSGVLRIDTSGKADELTTPPTHAQVAAAGGGWLTALVKKSEPQDWLLTTRLGTDAGAQWAVQPLP